MGLSSIGISFLILPLLCVSPRPSNFEGMSNLGMKRQASEGSLGLVQASDVDNNMVDHDSASDVNSVKTNSNQSDLVQSMALTCPPPVASFLR